MKASTLPVPGILLGTYPERRVPAEDLSVSLNGRMQALLAPLQGLRGNGYKRFAAKVESLGPEIAALSAEQRQVRLRNVRASLSHHGLTDPLMAQVFALVKQACTQEFGVRLYGAQLIAARIMLDNRLAEMATGEGKTLTAAVAAATAALAGIPVHVITVNDYLVARDAESLRPLYTSLGLSVGAITQPLDLAGRQQAYGCDITYCTAKELVFDYLRDSLVRGRARTDLHMRAAGLGAGVSARANTLLRGLCMAIVDEADSILIDEARVPLILSETCSNAEQRGYYVQALKVAAQMQEGQDFSVDRNNMSVELTDRGRRMLEQRSAGLGAVWRNRLHREETVCMALAAQHLYQRDRHYLVHEGTVAIIDESTGRLAAGRVWSRGLHQLIEQKEGCESSDEMVTVAQMTYQRFFQRYLSLGGMSGTLHEARSELLSVYRLHVVKVALRRPSRRKILPTRLFADQQAQWKAVVEQVKKVSAGGRPVLIGTDSVADSESLSACLTEAGLPHAVLNARYDREEAQIVSRAGEPGQITVATNMAGRGTDIPLGSGVAERGGLHLICCQHNASRRIDRQLVGRCARQGDPGSAQTLLSLDKPFISRFVPTWIYRRVSPSGVGRPAWLVELLVLAPQKLEEARQRGQRRE